MEKETIEFNWVEKGTKEPRKRITINVEEEGEDLKLSVISSVGIYCIVCSTLRDTACPKLT